MFVVFDVLSCYDEVQVMKKKDILCSSTLERFKKSS